MGKSGDIIDEFKVNFKDSGLSVNKDITSYYQTQQR